MSIADDIVATLILRGQEKFRGELRAVSKEVRSLGTSATESEIRSRGAFGRMEHGLARVGKAMLKVGAIATAAIAVGIAAAFAIGLKSVTEFQRATAQTNAVLRSTGGIANVTGADVERLSKNVSAYSEYSDIAARRGINMLLTFRNIRNEVGKGNDIFNRATSSLFDMSQAIGGDPVKQAIRLGKALNDPVRGITALNRVGVQFTDAQKKQVKALVESGNRLAAQKIILGELTKEFGGSAKAVGKTFAGSLERAKHALEEMLRGFAAPTLGAFTKGVLWLDDHALPKLQKGLHLVSDVLGIVFTGKVGEASTGRWGQMKNQAADFFQTLYHGQPTIGAVQNKATNLALKVRSVLGGAFKAAKIIVIDVLRYWAKLYTALHNLYNFLQPDLSSALHIVGILLKVGLGVGLAVVGRLLSKFGDLVKSTTAFMDRHKTAIKTVAIMIGIMSSALIVNTAVGIANMVVLKGIYIYARLAAAAERGMAVATAVLNAVMDANPIMLVVLAVIALAVGFIYAWKHSEKFRKFVIGAFKDVKKWAMVAWNWIKSHWPLLLEILLGPFGFAVVQIIKHWRGVINFFKKIPHEIGSAFKKLGSLIMAPFKWAFNEVAKLWNATMGKIHFKVPGWVPRFHGKSWGFPTIPTVGGGGGGLNGDVGGRGPLGNLPKAHTGGSVTSPGLVNMQPDEEIVWMPRGAAIAPLTIPQQTNSAGGTKVIQLVVDRKVLAQTVYRETSDRIART